MVTLSTGGRGDGGLLGYSLLGERVGCRVTSLWGSWFYGCFPLGKLVSGLLPARGESGLHDDSPLGERVGCMVTLAGEVNNNNNNVPVNCPSAGTRSMGIWKDHMQEKKP